MQDILNRIEEIGFLPVIKLKRPQEDSIRLGEALLQGGIPAAEVTFRAAGAEDAIGQLRKTFPELLTGAGTVVTMEQAKKAADAGAQFLVSPGLDEAVVRFAQSRQIPVFPGAVTPTEVMAAMKLGLGIVKFFPAEQYGGLKTIKALSQPFRQMRFIPTGGVSLQNLGQYMTLPCVVACGGSYMVTDDFIDSGNWAEITRLSRETRYIIDGARKPQTV